MRVTCRLSPHLGRLAAELKGTDHEDENENASALNLEVKQGWTPLTREHRTSGGLTPVRVV